MPLNEYNLLLAHSKLYIPFREPMNLTKSKTICLAFEDISHHKNCLSDKNVYRDFLESYYQIHPELFPDGFDQGFTFKGFIRAQKQKGFKMQRIRMKSNGDVYQIRPSFMMPYMTAFTDNVEKALYLMRFGVPFYALAYVFGKNAMYWYRIYISLGRASLVGSTIKSPEALPEDLLADEKHSRLKSERVYLPTTVAKGCILGVSVTKSAGTPALTEGYNDFKQEAHNVNPDYSPKSVNTDGWDATQKAWKWLFPQIILMACFLHAWLKIKDRCKRAKELFPIVRKKVWEVYHAPSIASFSQRIRRLKEWGEKSLSIEAAQQKLMELCDKSDQFKIAYQMPNAYRTSANLDRLMNYQDRILYAMQYLHGSLSSAKLAVRAMAMIWNFHPYCSNLIAKEPDRHSPFKDVNGFLYHPNWLHNMSVAMSLGGVRC